MGRDLSDRNDSGLFWSLHPAAKSSKAQRRILQLFAGDIVAFVTTNDDDMTVFDNLVRTSGVNANATKRIIFFKRLLCLLVVHRPIDELFRSKTAELNI